MIPVAFRNMQCKLTNVNFDFYIVFQLHESCVYNMNELLDTIICAIFLYTHLYNHIHTIYIFKIHDGVR